jgi:hypothetical protein
MGLHSTREHVRHVDPLVSRIIVDRRDLKTVSIGVVRNVTFVLVDDNYFGPSCINNSDSAVGRTVLIKVQIGLLLDDFGVSRYADEAVNGLVRDAVTMAGRVSGKDLCDRSSLIMVHLCILVQCPISARGVGRTFIVEDVGVSIVRSSSRRRKGFQVTSSSLVGNGFQICCCCRRRQMPTAA